MAEWLGLFLNRHAPREGWLSLGLLISIFICLWSAVAEVGWVANDAIIGWGMAGGLLMGILLAKRPSPSLLSWPLITLYALMSTAVWVGDLWPDFAVWQEGWPALTDFWRQNGALFVDRASSWLQAVINGGTSRETVVFLWGMSVLAWLVAAFFAWSVYRLYKPLWGVMAVGVALVINSYFGQANLTWLVLFVGLGTLLTAVINYTKQELNWQAAGVDYSDEVRLDMYFHAGGVAMVMMTAAMLVPSFSLSQAASAFQELPWVVKVEERLEEMFAGVEQPGRRLLPDSPGGAGTLPRSFLLGDPPELHETIVMTAVVTQNGEPLTYEQMAGTHWRGLSYDVYTGRGWTLSEEREQPLAPGDVIDLPEAGDITVRQSVNWLHDQRRLRYTLGLPRQFEDPVTVSWRGLSDLSRVSGEGGTFTAVSYLNRYSPTRLRQSSLDEVSPVLLARYTALPNSIPARVTQLAQDVSGDLTNPFDQARALEQFLRQYPYSLDVELPPEDMDPVEFFLFELQAGYCDYYASAMVVMARTLGIPARIGIGYLPQAPDSTGEQQIAQINGHSWAEVYFAEVGWVEFEPTAAFISPHESQTEALDTTAVVEDEPLPQTPLPIPETNLRSPSFWGWWLAGIPAFLVIVWWWRRQAPGAGEGVVWAYGRLQAIAPKIGYDAQPSHTPAEFTRALLIKIRPFARQYPRLAGWISAIPDKVERVGQLYTRQQYSPQKTGGEVEALRHWQQLRLPLQLIRIVTVIRGENRERDSG